MCLRMVKLNSPTCAFQERDARYGVGGMPGYGGGIGGMPGSGVMMMMAKYMKQELTSDAEEEGLVPNIPGRFSGAFAMRKVPSLSDLSDPESSLGELIFSFLHYTKAKYCPTGDSFEPRSTRVNAYTPIVITTEASIHWRFHER